MARGPVVILTYDPRVSARMWLMAEYLREVAELDRRIFPLPEQLVHWLGIGTAIEAVPIARDTPDWTLSSFWAHPERVLDAQARAGTSGFARMPTEVVASVVEAVRRDLEDGTWDERHGHLHGLAQHDAGLRLVTHSAGKTATKRRHAHDGIQAALGRRTARHGGGMAVRRAAGQRVAQRVCRPATATPTLTSHLVTPLRATLHGRSLSLDRRDQSVHHTDDPVSVADRPAEKLRRGRHRATPRAATLLMGRTPILVSLRSVLRQALGNRGLCV